MSYNNHLNPQLQAVLTCFGVTTAPAPPAPRRPRVFTQRNLGALRSSYISRGGWVCVFSFQHRCPFFFFFFFFAGVAAQHDSSFCTIWCWSFLLVTVEAVHFQSHDTPPPPPQLHPALPTCFVCLILFLWSLLKHPLNYNCCFFFLCVNLQ